MARYYRRRPYRRPYSVSFRFGRQRRRFNRQNLGAMQQRDIARQIIKVNTADTLAIATQGGIFAITSWQARDVLNSSNLFGKFKNVYDQFKINAIKVKIVPTDIETPGGVYMQTCIAWDRNGANGAGMVYEQLASYGSAKLGYYAPGTKTTMTHFIAAETIGEKTAYIATQSATDQNTALWNPHFILGFKGPAALGQDQGYGLFFAIEWSFDVTFRGVRYQ